MSVNFKESETKKNLIAAIKNYGLKQVTISEQKFLLTYLKNHLQILLRESKN